MRWWNGCCMFFFSSIYSGNCVICSDMGSPLSWKSGALWAKLHPETYTSASVSKTTSKCIKTPKHKFHFSDGKTFAKFYRKWMELMYVEAARCVKLRLEHKHLHIQPPYCHPVPGWLLYAPNSYSSLTSRGDSYVNFVTPCCCVVQCEWLAKEKYQQMLWKKCRSWRGWQFYWHSVCTTRIFVCVCLWTENLAESIQPVTSIIRIVLVSVFIRCHLSQTRLSIHLL